MDIQIDYFLNAINAINSDVLNLNDGPLGNLNIRPSFYRQLSFSEEREMYDRLVESPNNTIVLYDIRHSHRYYFGKINERIYQVVTSEDFSRIYTAHIINFM